MSDNRRNDDEWSVLLDVWAPATPPSKFADRLLAACDLPPPVQLAVVRDPPPRRMRASGILVCAAVAAAVVLIPFALHRRQPPANAANVVTLGNSYDLGLEHD